jgi:hypothetical protein
VKSLAIALLILLGAAGAILIAESGSRDRRDRQAESFQRLVGGVGFGTALDLSGCAYAFDPRLDERCSEDRGPIPAGSCFCPRHDASPERESH